ADGGEHAVEGEAHHSGLDEIPDSGDFEGKGESDREQDVIGRGRNAGPEDLEEDRKVKHGATGIRPKLDPGRIFSKRKACYSTVAIGTNWPSFTVSRLTGLRTVWSSFTTSLPVIGRSKVFTVRSA